MCLHNTQSAIHSLAYKGLWQHSGELLDWLTMRLDPVHHKGYAMMLQGFQMTKFRRYHCYEFWSPKLKQKDKQSTYPFQYPKIGKIPYRFFLCINWITLFMNSTPALIVDLAGLKPCCSLSTIWFNYKYFNNWFFNFEKTGSKEIVRYLEMSFKSPFLRLELLLIFLVDFRKSLREMMNLQNELKVLESIYTITCSETLGYHQTHFSNFFQKIL